MGNNCCAIRADKCKDKTDSSESTKIRLEYNFFTQKDTSAIKRDKKLDEIMASKFPDVCWEFTPKKAVENSSNYDQHNSETQIAEESCKELKGYLDDNSKDNLYSSSKEINAIKFQSNSDISLDSSQDYEAFKSKSKRLQNKRRSVFVPNSGLAFGSKIEANTNSNKKWFSKEQMFDFGDLMKKK